MINKHQICEPLDLYPIQLPSPYLSNRAEPSHGSIHLYFKVIMNVLKHIGSIGQSNLVLTFELCCEGKIPMPRFNFRLNYLAFSLRRQLMRRKELDDCFWKSPNTIHTLSENYVISIIRASPCMEAKSYNVAGLNHLL